MSLINICLMADIRRELAQAMQGQGVTPQELAYRIRAEEGFRLGPQSIHQFLYTTRHQPRPLTLFAIAKALGYRVVLMKDEEVKATMWSVYERAASSPPV